MYFIVSLFVLFSSSLALKVHGQVKVQDFYVNYSVDIESDKPLVSLLSIGTSLELAFVGPTSKTNLSVAGGTNKMVIVADNNAEIATVLLDLPEGKKAFQLDATRRNEMEEALQKIGDNPIRFTDSYKNIAGYACQKVLVKHLATGANIILYLSKDFTPKQDLAYQAFYQQMKGFPLGIVVRKDATTVRIMATAIRSNLQASDSFSTSIPSAYEKTSLEAIKIALQNKYGVSK